MADKFGATSLPVALSGAVVDDAEQGKVDPTAFALLAFIVAVLRSHGAAEWAALRPRSAGDTEGLGVVRKAFVRDPERGSFASEKILPAMFLWRRQGRQEDATSDYRHETATFSLLWVLPPDDQGSKEALREPFVNAAMKVVGAALRQGRDPAWVDAADDDVKASTRLADDDAIVLPLATSTSSVNLSGAGLTGLIGNDEMTPRRGLTITTSAAAGAYNPDDPIVITYLDWLGNETTGSVYLEEDGGEVANPTFEAAQVVSIALPAQQLTTGQIRVGVVARAGRGSSVLKMAQLMSVGMTEWAPHTLSIQALASDGSIADTKRYYGALATISAVEQLVRDPAVRAWPLPVSPAGLDIDVSIDGETMSRAEL